MTAQELWQRYQQHYCAVEALEMSLDISRMKFDGGFFHRLEPAMQGAYAAM